MTTKPDPATERVLDGESNEWVCAIWRCGHNADWRDPANAQYGFCSEHASPEHFWPVSAWAREEVKRDG